ncbi:MAG: SufD family Fe-S cluster assembly protein, partial [Pseudomonadota bacterium]
MSGIANRTPAEEAFVSGFAAAEASLPSADWLKRKQALAAFSELGLPHRRIEAWKYTDLRNLVDGAYPAQTETTLVDVEQVQSLAKQSIFGDISRSTAVFVDGRFRSELSSLPESDTIEIVSISDAAASAPGWLSDTLGTVVPQQDDAVSALNTAYMSDGAAIHVTGESKEPLELVFVHSAGQPRTVSQRMLIVVDAGASCELFETHIAPADARYVSTVVTEVVLGDGATFDHVKTQRDGAEAVHLANLHAKLGAEATFNSFSATTGGRVSRQQAFVEYAGEHTTANISGVYLLA